MKTRFLVVLFALTLVASPALADTLNTGGAGWGAFVSPTGTGAAGTPFWDTRSWDGAGCNVAFWVTNIQGCNYQDFYRNAPGFREPTPNFFLGNGATTLTVTGDATSTLTGVIAGAGVTALYDATEFGWFNLDNRAETHPLINAGQPIVGFQVPSGNYGFYAHITSDVFFPTTHEVTYYSDTTYGGRSQFAVFDISRNGGQTYAFGFEDLTGPSDYDYNDVMGILNYTTSVPEPSSMLLLGMGLMGGAVALRKRRVKS